MPKHGSIAYCFLAMRTPLNVDAGAVSLSGPRSPSSSQIAAWSPTSIFNRTTLAPPPPPVDTTLVHSPLFDSFFFRTNLWINNDAVILHMLRILRSELLMGDLRLLLWCYWRLKSSEVLYRFDWLPKFGRIIMLYLRVSRSDSVLQKIVGLLVAEWTTLGVHQPIFQTFVFIIHTKELAVVEYV